MTSKKHYNAFAALFRYPVQGYREKTNTCLQLIRSDYKEAAEVMKRFVEFINNESLDKVEEIFTRTFHIQAICYLDLGYVLFGEDYKRGDFLVHMKQEQRKINNDCGEELPDNLANVLSFMHKTPEEEFLNEFATRILIPAVKKMLKEFDTAKLDLKRKILRKKHRALIEENAEHGNVYQEVLKALLIVLEKDFESVKYKPTEVKPSFGAQYFTNCGTCAPTYLSTEKLKQ